MATANPLQVSSTSSSKAHLKQHPDKLELRIFASSVDIYSGRPATIDSDALATLAMTRHPPPHSISDFIRLLGGPLNDFLLYCGQERSKWLIDIAHDICDPVAQRGLLRYWDGHEWTSVTHTDSLIASVYLYTVPEGVIVALSKISARDGKSRTTATGNAGKMAKLVKQRDGRCWVTGLNRPLVNSHLCPKRMGDHLARFVFDTFVPTPSLATLSISRSIYDEVYGISLMPTLDALFDKYELGLRFVSTVRNSSFLIFYNWLLIS